MDSGSDPVINTRKGEYKILAKLGQGAYGSVYKAQHVHNKRIVAIKRIPSDMLKDERHIKYFERELLALSLIDHSHVIKLIDAFRTTSAYYIVMEFCNRGDLSSYLGFDQNEPYKAHNRLPETKGKAVIRQICQGIQGIARQGFVHRDIKLANILIHQQSEGCAIEDTIIKIGDLGFARPLEPQSVAESHLGSPLTTAPEILVEKMEYNHQVDVWSIGVISFEILTGFAPFMASDLYEFTGKVAQGDIKIPKTIELSNSALNFLNQCLQSDPKRRISIQKLLEHPWFSKKERGLVNSSILNLMGNSGGGMQVSLLAPPGRFCEEIEQQKDVISLNTKVLREFDEEVKKQAAANMESLRPLESKSSMEFAVERSDEVEDFQYSFKPIESRLTVKATPKKA